MKKFIIEVLIIGIIIFLISTFLIQVCFVKGSSMEPTLKNNDIILVEKINKTIKSNDIVLIKKNNKTILKRVVATENDTIQIKNNKVYVNDKVFDNVETNRAGILKNKIKLKKHEYFVLGDNRDNSIDSRDEGIGIIKKSEIIGKKCF